MQWVNYLCALQFRLGLFLKTNKSGLLAFQYAAAQ